MKLSNKLEYACRVLAQLGRSYGQDKLAHIDALAEIEQVPANYLVQILNELRTAGLITSKRGKQGGYALSREPSQIPLSAIVLAVDAELLEQHLSNDGHSGERVCSIWADIAQNFEQQIARYTLEDLVVNDAQQMYYI